ncbi:alpha/beta fold hydrolase [soil metagenome]
MASVASMAVRLAATSALLMPMVIGAAGTAEAAPGASSATPMAGASAVLSAASASSPAASTGTLTECRLPGLRNSVLCGVVRRPLDPARAGSPTIDVHYVVVPAMARRKLPDPVFLLAGGPGQSAIGLAPSAMGTFARLNNRRDIVFVDQRGTGRSAPLECEDTTREPLADQSGTEQQFRRLMDCKARLLKLPYIRTPADLGAFTTTLAMQDLDAVRRQLGAQRIDLVGASYGTRAALEYQRQFPASVRRIVIDGVAPADMVLPTSFSVDAQAAFDAVLVACERESACKASFPALRTDWAALLHSLPKEVTAVHPLTGQPERFILTREMVLGAVRGPLYVPALAAALPAAISEAAQGRFEGLMGMSALLASRKGMQLAMGMHLSVVCSEDVPLMEARGSTPDAAAGARRDAKADAEAGVVAGRVASDAPSTDFGDEQARMYRRACAAWPRGAVPAAFYAVPRSASPVLLLSGGLDPATPPRHAARVALALGPLAQHVVVPNAGHGVMNIGCMRDVVYRFIAAVDDRDAVAVDASCVKAIPRPPAFQPLRLPAASSASGASR